MAHPRNEAVLVLLLVCCASATAQAAEITRLDGGGNRIEVRDPAPLLTPVSITQSIDPNSLVDGISVACTSGDVARNNSWLRVFDLDGDHGLGCEFCVESIDYGIELAVGPQNITANLYCLADGLPFLYAFMQLVGTNTVPQPDSILQFFNIPVEGCCDPETESLVVELRSEDCVDLGTCTSLFLGMNDLGQIAPTYISADDCSVIDPIDLADLGFPDAHAVMIVNGTEASLLYENTQFVDVPAADGNGTLQVVPPPPNGGLQPTSEGFDYTDVTLQYTTGPGDVGLVTLDWKIERPFGVCESGYKGFTHSSVDGFITVGGGAAINDVVLVQNTTSVLGSNAVAAATPPFPGGHFNAGPAVGTQFGPLSDVFQGKLRQEGILVIVVPPGAPVGATYTFSIPGSFHSMIAVDVDEDGVLDHLDNCPADHNPSQEDGDHDLLGDACDLCPEHHNPGQSDLNADGEGDHCDTDDGLIYIRWQPLQFVEWQQEAGFDAWNLYRGDLEVLVNTGVYTQASASNPLALRECGLHQTSWQDDATPEPGHCAMYLVTGTTGEVEGGLGSDSSGTERPNTNPCP